MYRRIPGCRFGGGRTSRVPRIRRDFRAAIFGRPDQIRCRLPRRRQARGPLYRQPGLRDRRALCRGEIRRARPAAGQSWQLVSADPLRRSRAEGGRAVGRHHRRPAVRQRRRCQSLPEQRLSRPTHRRRRGVRRLRPRRARKSARAIMPGSTSRGKIVIALWGYPKGAPSEVGAHLARREGAHGEGPWRDRPAAALHAGPANRSLPWESIAERANQKDVKWVRR